MSGIASNVAAPLAGGQLCSGMTIVLTLQMMWDHGLNVGIRHDKKRQVLLNLICFICAINSSILYGFIATKDSTPVAEITAVITFVCVQYSLVILNHNTVIRAANLLSDGGTVDRKRLDWYCSALYLFPPIALIPIWLAFAETAGTNKAMFTSNWNSQVFKPLNIALIMVTAALATITDILLLRKVDSHFVDLKQMSQQPINTTNTQTPGAKPAAVATPATERTNKAMRKNLWINYAIAWFLLFADVVLKSVIAAGVPLLFDSIVTILTVAMRSRCNLQFGLEMQKAFTRKSTTKSSSVSHPTSASGTS